jgi:hypothetical protein
MPKRPPVNPNVHVIADHAKHAYYTCTRILADVHYRLAELMGVDQRAVDGDMACFRGR